MNREQKTFRRAKIVCTIGPATSSPAAVGHLIRAGMDVARLNFSHGTHQEHADRIKTIRQASMDHEKPMGILADLQGPKIRTGQLEGGKKVFLHAGQKFVITTDKVMGTAERVNTIFQQLPREVHKGDRILLSDGEIALHVESVRGRDVICQVENGGQLGEHTGINLPGVKLKIPAVTPKDHEDLVFALEQGANFVAVSFVRSAKDVLQAKSGHFARRARYPGDRQAGKARGD